LSTAVKILPAARAENSLLDRRGAWVLSLVALAQAALACWVLAGPKEGVPLSGLPPAQLLPRVLCGMAVVLAALAGPFFNSSGAESGRAARLPRALFAALCQALMAYFFLLVCARLEPLENGGLALAALWIGLTALIGALLPPLLPRAYPGVIFVWLAALPVLAYMIAEAVLSSAAGSSGWNALTGREAEAARNLVRNLLSFSPGTAAIAALDGQNADGSEAAGVAPLVCMALLAAAALATLALRMDRRRKTGAAEPHFSTD
jgi:hypothetical protein